MIKRIVQATNNESNRNMRKSYSPKKNQNYTNVQNSKQNLTNSIIMRRQLNALKDISPPTKTSGYSFVYDDNKSTTSGNYSFERKILQQIAKNKPKINPPSPHK